MALREKVMLAACGNENATVELIDKFSPLLKKYASLLRSEDCFSDLQLKLLELLPDIASNPRLLSDAEIVGYISSSIRHEYIAISKKHSESVKKFTQENIDSPSMQFLVNQNTAKGTQYEDVEISIILENLTPLEREAVVDIVIIGYTASELASKMHCSRQSVNQAKQRGLKKLAAILFPKDVK